MVQLAELEQLVRPVAQLLANIRGRHELRGSGQVRLLVIQPTPFCNLDCTYCYLPNRSSTARMAGATLERIANVVVAGGWLASDATVVWHAGEPLVMPPAWYEDAFALLQSRCPPGTRLTHAFQTNGTLLSERWLPVVGRPDVRLGISIDGPARLHDLRRRSRTGRGTFASVIRGVRLARSAQVPFHVITVLGRESLSHADALIDFYLAEGIEQVCFNVEEIEGSNLASSLAAHDVEHAFCRFFERIIARLAGLEGPLWIREIASALATLAAPPHELQANIQTTPLAILSIDRDGNMSTFSPELLGSTGSAFGGFHFGNVRECDPGDMFRNEHFLRAWTQILAGVDSCRAGCPWFRWCGGGAPANKYFEAGSFAASETLYCRLTKQLVLETVLRAIEQGQAPALARAA